MEHLTMEQKLAFGIAAVQAPVMMAVLLMHSEPVGALYTARLDSPPLPPPPPVTSLAPRANGVNTSLLSMPLPATIILQPAALTPPISLSIQEYGLSPLFLIPSLLIVIFASVTHQLHDLKLLDNALEYSEESESQAGIWTPFLWLTSGFAHAAVFVRLTSPVDLFQLVVAIALPIVCLARLCVPRGPHGAPSPAFHFIGYAAGLALVWDAMRVRHGTHAVAFSLLACADLLLVMGHTYDHQPSMLLVGNCRLVYMAWLGFLLLMAYSI